MKTEKNILIAFLLNLSFSIFEIIGGIFTGSIAIISDAIHDIGDAASIGISYFLERKSKKKANGVYTYGYARYSVVGGLFTTLILIGGSAIVIYNAIHRMIHPIEIHYDGIILFAVIGVIVNFAAAYFTHDGDSLNQKAVNLHMIEDVLGWAVVLIGAIIMRFTDWAIMDPLLSIGVAVFILIHSIRNLQEVFDVFLEKVPNGISLEEIRTHLIEIEGVADVHHIHIWSLDGHDAYATMHIVSDGDCHEMKERVRGELREHGIVHATLELETNNECCHEMECNAEINQHGHHHRHHH